MSLPSWSHALKIGDIITENKTGQKYEIHTRNQIASYYSPDSLPYAVPAYLFTIRKKGNTGHFKTSYSDDYIEANFTPEKYRETPLYRSLQGQNGKS